MNQPTRKLTVGVLSFGGFGPLLQRCLDSWLNTSDPDRRLADFRLGLNIPGHELVRRTSEYADALCDKFGVPVRLYIAEGNRYKYPMMRRMLYDESAAVPDVWHWFDDDSYLTRSDWWSVIGEVMDVADVCGKQYLLRMRGNQWDWIVQQPWFNPAVGPPPRGRFTFSQGSCWAASSEVLRRWDWPTKDLRHCGGDSLFGELCRHTGLRVSGLPDGARVNAGWSGEHSSSPRRGFSEAELGVAYGPDYPRDHQHHCFEVQVIVKEPS